MALRDWLLSAARVLGFSVVGAYAGAGLLLWWSQERMIFPVPGGFGRDALDQAAAELGARPLDLVASDGTRLYAWHRAAGGGRQRLVLFFHGNGEAVSMYTGLYRVLQQAGWDVLALAYRGYPGSEGSPSEAGLALDAEAAWAWATGPGGYRPERIVVHGRSLGGGVATTLVAGDANPAGMVLESTFASLRGLARRTAPVYPVDQLLRHPFDSDQRAALLGVPVLVMHSRGDELIPPELGGRALAPLIAEADYHEVEGWSHNDCLPLADPGLREVYLAFLERLVP